MCAAQAPERAAWPPRPRHPHAQAGPRLARLEYHHYYHRSTINERGGR